MKEIFIGGDGPTKPKKPPVTPDAMSRKKKK